MPIRPENRNRYPADWPEISRRIRFVRALGQCECEGECGLNHTGRCTARHNAPNPRTGTKVVLTVAHLDHTPENCDDTNLKAMCNGCHLHYDRDHHRETAARTRAAETASWNTPLPGLEPEPAAAPKDAVPAPITKSPRADKPTDRVSLQLPPRDWEAQALCRETDPELFFGQQYADALTICRRCPVKQDCLEHALTVPDLSGIWGGTTRRERDRLRAATTGQEQP